MKKVIIYGLAISFLLAGGISFFASSSPDGLERVAEDKGFLSAGEGKEIFKAPLPDYSAKFIENTFLSNAFAGIAGTLLVFSVIFAAGKILIKRK